jgi:hypothetical protein
MIVNPEDLNQFFENDDQSQDAAHSPLRAYFPVAVIERLMGSSIAAPVQFFRYLKRLELEPALQESFTLDLFRFLGDEDTFDWPVDDRGVASLSPCFVGTPKSVCKARMRTRKRSRTIRTLPTGGKVASDFQTGGELARAEELVGPAEPDWQPTRAS